MKMLVIFTALVLAAAPVWGQTTKPQDVDAELESLHAALKSQGRALDSVHSKLEAATKELKELKLAATKREAELKNQIDDLQKQLQLALDDRDHWKLIAIPGNRLAASDGVPVVTPKQLEVMGDRYVGKRVKILGGLFGWVATNVDDLPGVTAASNGLVARINVKEYDSWLSIAVYDPAGGINTKIYAGKQKFGDLLVSLRRGRVLNLSGVVISLQGTTDYGLVCDTIELVKAPDNKPEQSR